jgi:CHAD domain-containing protein
MEQILANKQMIFAVPERFSLDDLGQLLSDKLKTRIEHTDGKRIYLDSFDWRLYRSGMVLELECGGGPCLLVCRELGSGKILLSRMIRKTPKNASDFSSVGPQMMLKEILGRRSLIAHATLNAHTDNLLLLNSDGKTVMRVELRRDQIVSPQPTGHVILSDALYLFPFRGYETEFKDRLRWIKRDTELSPITEDPLLSVLGALDITPGLYTSRPVFSLNSEQPALEVLVNILKKFLQIMNSNIAGAREDDDPEYLHDFLVAVRRTSILIDGFSSVFPANNLSSIVHGFQWIEQETASIRDLDIYMSLFDDFESRVDADHRLALNSLYLFLQEQKKRELRRMRTSLNSPRYHRLIESWSEFLRRCENAGQLPKDALAPIGELALGRVKAIFREFIQASQGQPQDASVKEMCELHQISKHLGYHLDVFSSLFPGKKIGKLLKAHAKLQSSLNHFRDMNLQYSRLREYKSGMKRSQAVRKVSLEAVEQLIADRKSEKTKAREKSVKQIKRFTRKKMRKRFSSLQPITTERGA